jgi:hypothetical protein
LPIRLEDIEEPVDGPAEVADRFAGVDYFDVRVDGGRILLVPAMSLSPDAPFAA